MEGIRGTMHPLQTPLILECIFGNLALANLKSCRLVCRAWRESGAVAMQKDTKISFFNDDDDKILDFLELVESEWSTFSESPFVSNYGFESIDLDVTEFFEVCGASVKSLYLCEVEFDSLDDFRRVIFQLCPNMTELKLMDIVLMGEVGRSEEPTVWVPPRFPPNKNLRKLSFIMNNDFADISYLEILSHFPELQNIRINGHGDGSERIFQALGIVREHNRPYWNVRSIDFCFRNLSDPQHNLRYLVEGNLSLENLKVIAIDQPERVRVFGEILGVHATSLKTLSVHGNMAVNTFDTPDNHIFEKLKTLGVSFATLNSTNFLRNCPNLQKLELSTITLHAVFSEEPLNDWTINSCTEMVLDSEHFRESALQRLLRRLPNLEKLTIDHCDNEKMAVICEKLPELTYLNLSRSTVDDCGISGLDKEDVERINEEEADGEMVWRPITVPRPNISSLKELKWVMLDLKEGNGLGLCAALFGIQQLRQLQHFKLTEFESPTWDRLHSQFPWRNP